MGSTPQLLPNPCHGRSHCAHLYSDNSVLLVYTVGPGDAGVFHSVWVHECVPHGC